MVDNTIKDTVKLSTNFATIYKNENGHYIAVDADGNEKDITANVGSKSRTLVQSSNGEQLVIDSKGQLMGVTEYKQTGGNKTLLAQRSAEKESQMATTGNVTFTSIGDYLFDTYDSYKSHTASQNYAQRFLSIGAGNYRPAYACIESYAKVKLNADPFTNITFKTERGVPVLCNNGELSITGVGDHDTLAIYAYKDTTLVGKVNVMCYDKVTRKICLVPIGKSNVPSAETLKNGLDAIFAKLMVDFDVTVSEAIDIDYSNGTNFTHGGSGVIGVYNTDQKAAITKLEELGTDNETVYLFMVEDAVTLNETDGYTVTSGYMPRGYQYGFIYKELTNARTIAHEIAHGAFHLEHTFAQSNYLAPEATTDNLMDYNGGTTLNHWQWKDVHDPKRVWLKWAQGESGAEMNENDAIVNQILATIHNANANQQNHCTIDTKGIGFESHKYPLGDKTIDVAIAKHVFEDVTINCNKSSCAVEKCNYAFEKEGSFIKFIFTTYTENESTNALEILVEEEYADELANWLFVSWEQLMTMDELTAQQIAIVRDGISKIEDETKRGELYLELQKKVPYHNQRDNIPDYDNNSKNKTQKVQYNADRMCNVTSLAMAFEMLGVSKEDAIAKLSEDGIETNDIENKDFEDVIDYIRVKKAFSYTENGEEKEALDRTSVIFWKKVAEYLGLSANSIDIYSSDVNSAKWKTHKPKIEKALKDGDGVILSLFRGAGPHIVRLQNISSDGLVVDDPYGKLKNMAKRELPGDTKYTYDANDKTMTLTGGQKGKDVTITWNELNVGVDDNGCGGYEEMDGNEVWKSEVNGNSKIIYYNKDWAQDISPCEYIIEEKEEIGEDGNKKKTSLVKCHGGMVKYYVIIKKQ